MRLAPLEGLAPYQKGTFRYTRKPGVDYKHLTSNQIGEDKTIRPPPKQEAGVQLALRHANVQF